MHEDIIKTLNELHDKLRATEGGLIYPETSAAVGIKQAAVDLAAADKLRFPVKEEAPAPAPAP